MDIDKLRIDNFKNINIVNFPSEIDLGITSTNDEVEVVIYYIENIKDLTDFSNYVNSLDLPKENRTILVFKKGQSHFNRDSIITPFKNEEIKGFKFKAPMLCSLNNDYSAFVMMKEKYNV